VSMPDAPVEHDGGQLLQNADAEPGEQTVDAAGVVVWREARPSRGAPPALEVLLVHSARNDEWGWPKGKREAGEPLPVCAVREVAEETGTQVVLGRALPQTTYPIPEGGQKVVHYWTGHVVRNQAPTAGVEEIDEIRWLPAQHAGELLAHPDDAMLLAAVRGYAEAGVLDTTPLIVLRHARSRPRASWSRADADRPLVAVGKRQAVSLVPLLSCWRPKHVLCSPWQRCRQTLAPFVAASGVKVRTKGGFTEDGARRHPQKPTRHVARLLADDQASLVCTHRPVLPRILARLAKACSPEVAGELPAKDPYLDPAELLVAHVARHARGGRTDPVVVAVERHRGR